MLEALPFSADEDAAIGRLVRAFGELEYVLGGLFVTLHELRHGNSLKNENTAESKELEKILGYTIGQYVKPLEQEAASLTGEAQITLFRISRSLKEISEIRNIICHGAWRRDQSGGIVVHFWSRKALKAMREAPGDGPEQTHVNLQRINALSEVVSRHTYEVTALRQSFCEVARDLKQGGLEAS